MLYLQAVVQLRFGQGSALLAIEPILPSDRITVLGATVPRDRLYLAGIVVLTTAVLWAVYRFTRFGLATRAAAETEKGAVLLGLSPDLLGAANWVVAAVLAGAATILFAPIAGIDPVTTTLLIVPALAAALLGGLSSFAVTAAAGLGIGMLQSLLLKLQADWSWLPDGTQEALPFLLVLVAIVVRGRSLPTRGALVEGRLPGSPHPRRAAVTALVLGAAVGVALLTLGSTWRLGLITSMVWAVLCLSIVVLTGFVGQISLAQMAFAGIAGFAVARLSADHGIPFPVAPLLAALVAVGVGVVAGLPAVRVRGCTSPSPPSPRP
ncbi:MAG: hypothetical protein M5U14_12175 [Acidimicrobiia bacterium]|nr:hypothetical protein [Acidimicrobiia bacterium]